MGNKTLITVVALAASPLTMLFRLAGYLDVPIVFYDRESTHFNICSLNISC